MPIYEYECTACGYTFEEWQRDFKEREINCPECGGKAKRLVSHTSFILKGSGWYVTDYARSNPSSSGNGNGKKNGKQEAKASEPPKTKSDSSSAQSSKN